jgi:hypothetical protein
VFPAEGSVSGLVDEALEDSRLTACRIQSVDVNPLSAAKDSEEHFRRPAGRRSAG